jgi:hypothetical protein
MYTVYSITVPAEHKTYVGFTSGRLCERFGRGEHYIKNKPFYADIVKYGWDNLEKKVLFTTPIKLEAQRVEALYIFYLGTHLAEYGYNKYLNRQRLNEATGLISSCRPVKNLGTGEVYKSVAAAAEAIGVKPNTLYSAISKERICHGTIWVYADFNDYYNIVKTVIDRLEK